MDGRQLDPQRFRHAMSRFPTGVTILTTRSHDGTPEVMTANAVISVSLEPALLLASVKADSRWLGAARAHGRFAVDVLSGHQEALAQWCADRARHDRPEWLTGFGLESSPLMGLPTMRGAAATLECEWHQEVPAGDHVLVLGAVHEATVHDAGGPALVFADRCYATAVPRVSARVSAARGDAPVAPTALRDTLRAVTVAAGAS